MQVSKLTSGVTAVSAGTLTTSDSAGFTCAIVRGAAKCWGATEHDAIGYDLPDKQLVPTIVPGLEAGVSAIASNVLRCAIRGGEVLCWGLDNRRGQLGDGTFESKSTPITPVTVVGLGSSASSIGVGDAHACAVVGGDVMCWGSNTFGELGNNTTAESSSTPLPVQF